MNAWIDETNWLPRIHPRKDIEARYQNFVIKNRKVFVVGDPVEGYLSFDSEDGEVTSLFVNRKGEGIGKRLLDHVKGQADRLSLWTFENNTGARRFYAREGFVEVQRTSGENEEGLPDVQLIWERKV